MGLIELATGKKTPWLDANRGKLFSIGEGLAGGEGLKYLGQGMQVDDVFRQKQAEEQRRIDAILQEGQQRNHTLDWLKSNGREDLLAAVKGGMPIADAWKEALKPSPKPAERKIIKGKDGYNYYADTKERVLPELGESAPVVDKDAFGYERDLRKDYYGTDVVKTYNKVRDAYERVRTSATAADGPGDVALIFNYMKMLDPGSVVREGEFATAENSGGVGAQVANIYNKLLSGERLPPQLREKFVKLADSLYMETAGNLGSFNNQYGGVLDNWQVSRDNVLIMPEEYEAMTFGAKAPPESSQNLTGTTRSNIGWSAE